MNYPSDKHPFHTELERPTMVRILDEILEPSTSALDAACGSGFYSAYLRAQGIKVCAFDCDPKALELARERVADVKFVQADLLEPLPYSSGVFDLIVCALALQLIENIDVPIREFARVLKPGGKLLLSIPHPFATWQDNYFSQGKVVDLPRFHRPLSAYTAALEQAGFCLERLLEPQTTENIADIEQWRERPGLIVVLARLN